jgi:hypothetical protein
MNAMALLALASWVTLMACDAEPVEADAGDPPEPKSLSCDPISGQDLFQRKIAPLLDEARPSSCNECHLTGLDLGSFVRETPCRTMACMAEQGLVDLAQPSDSLVLAWIARANPADASSNLITQDVIDEEYEAMLDWIEYSARCGEEACEPIENPCGEDPSWEDCEVQVYPEPTTNFDDPGDCSDATLEAMFAAKVYTWRGRCFPCHFEDQEIEAPKWIKVGSCEVGASRTLHAILERGLVDPADPAQSLLLLKPLAEDEGGVYHEGHEKIAHTQEPTYLDFLAWIERYSACQP